MKKLNLSLIISFITFLAHAQQNQELTDFNTYSQNIESKRRDASKAKDYAAAVANLTEWVGRYEQLSPATKKVTLGYSLSVYYNLACYTALEGKKEEAISWFKKAADAGYSNYSHTLVDTDLDSVRNDEQFKKALLKVRERGDYGYILKNSGPYSHENTTLPVFTYQSASAPELIALKNRFNLDSISGNGDEISKFKKLLFWAHNIVTHDGNSNNPPSRNAIDLIEVCKKENRGVNCRMMATILRDAYQAEGFEARIVTCFPKDTADFDCHVINIVWSKTMNKWVWMDPTFNAYVSDEKGNLLNIEEVRERLVNDSPLVLNEDANWNNKQKETKDYYLGYYMSKNLFWLECSLKSEWNVETRKTGKTPITYINLYPGKYNNIDGTKKISPDRAEYAVNNPAYFWQKP